MSKAARLPNANNEDRFEEDIEGIPENFGSIDDWETEAVLKMRKLMKGQSKENPDDAYELVERKLALYRCTLKLMNENPKLAMSLGSKGGFQAIMAHVLKKSIHYAAEKEMEPYARAISVYLPGQKQAAINDEARGGLVKDADATKKLVKKYQAAAAREIDV
jgi:hypothetical protein